MPDSDIQKRYNRDDEQKPGRPPRTAAEPRGAEPSVNSDKTMTDPASGEPKRQPPAPGRAASDEVRR
ncbi:hypothetical protein DJ021_18330 [Phenylobacterium hankyongense]|uniref:Uncharacterized protein n=1 Tax=Phenylobacterium hankyongense TaxID=1813876 RepID=A0A328ACY5_9CAUL|nr:hypothetical protein [Phenylobacterium hankyongense]RAK52455.1 hypothetical protein DJ021_18330 [Phenylobacterium hankyongense]